MPIVYLNLEIKLHGLSIVTEAELKSLLSKIEDALAAVHPNFRYDNDLEISIEEQAGELTP